MTLTRFVELPEVRKAIDEAMIWPSAKEPHAMRATPTTRHYMLVGTAFDYLLRFIIERANGPKVVTRKWIAESALERFISNSDALVIDAQEGIGRIDLEESLKKLKRPEAKIAQEIRVVLDDARELHRQFLDDGKVSDDLLDSSVLLASLDFMFRSGQPPPDWATDLSQDREGLRSDLRSLAEIVPIKRFIAQRTCVLNPTFGEASRRIGGADGDLYFDGVLVDFKTSKNFRLDKEDRRQIVGYAVLASIGGIAGIPQANNLVTAVGFYASRFGELVVLPMEEAVDMEKFSKLVAWFEKNIDPKRVKPGIE